MGGKYPWLPAEEFEYDEVAGHGTHTAGSAAGATLNNPGETVACGVGEVLSCVGGCIDEDRSVTTDDLVTTAAAQYFDIDRLCPLFGCDGDTDELCLSEGASDTLTTDTGGVGETLTNNGGTAQGAKLAIFDAFHGAFGLSAYAGNDMWESCADADCKLHSNSYGSDYECQLGGLDTLYDYYMYEVRRPDWSMPCVLYANMSFMTNLSSNTITGGAKRWRKWTNLAFRLFCALRAARPSHAMRDTCTRHP